MKKITLLTLICIVFTTLSGFAQMMGGGMSGGMRGGQSMPPQQQQQRSFDVNFIGASGYFEIDSQEALERINIKKSESTKQAVIEIIDQFNASTISLVETNRPELDILEFAKDNIEMAEGDIPAMREIMMSVNSSMMVIRPIMVEMHKDLNASMAEILSPKELKGWEKFYKSACRESSFDPDAKVRQAPSQGEGGERPERGEGGGGQGRPQM